MSAYLDSAIGWDSAITVRYEIYDLGAILTLDIALLNRDRNAGNLLIEADLERPMRVWAIDHERLGVAELDFLRQHQHASLHELPRFELTKSQPRGLPLDMVEDAAMVIAGRFAALEKATVVEILTEALSISGYDLVEVLAVFEEWTSLLHQRCLDAPALVTRYITAQRA
jgi:hypothetical protein